VKKLIVEEKVNTIQMTPSAIQWIAMTDPKLRCFANLEVIMVGGEDWNGRIHKLLRENTHARLYNMYGPTETTIWSSIAEVTNQEELDLGEPIRNTRFYILDDAGFPTTEGELYIAGAGLARGYRNAEELTQERFITLIDTEGERVYQTGDLVRRLEDGRIQYLGRLDEQVKIHGHRVELGEIEESTNTIAGVKESCACYDVNTNGGELICFYLSEQPMDEQTLFEELKMKLPKYMIPKRLIRREAFLYTESQKLDRKMMLAEYRSNQQLNWEIEPKQESEVVQEVIGTVDERVQEIVAKILERPMSEIRMDLPLEDYAFDSFGYVTMIVQIEEQFGISFGTEALSPEVFHNLGEICKEVKHLQNHDME